MGIAAEPMRGTTTHGALDPSGYTAQQMARINRNQALWAVAWLATALGVGLSVMLGDTIRSFEYVVALAFAVAAFVYSIHVASKIWRSLQDAMNHSVMVDLCRFGNATRLAAEIDREVRSGRHKAFSKCLMSRSWVLAPGWFRLVAVPLSDLVWAWERIVDSTANGVILMVASHEDDLWVPCRDSREAQAILRAISERAPWAFLGHSHDQAVSKLVFKKEKFIREVRERREAFKRQDRQ